MTEKQFQCPDCREKVTFSGHSGERKEVFCPYCGSKGRITLPKMDQRKDYAIEVSNLKKVYGDLVAVNEISFHVNKGEIFAFLGPNGAGKTTTVEMIESIRRSTAGTITLLGKDIKTHFHNIKKNNIRSILVLLIQNGMTQAVLIMLNCSPFPNRVIAAVHV